MHSLCVGAPNDVFEHSLLRLILHPTQLAGSDACPHPSRESANSCMMGVVKLGGRLTIVLLLAVSPVILGYTWWSVQRSTGAYITDLKRELRTAGLGLTPAMENALRRNEWADVRDVLDRMSTDSTLAALLGADGRVWYGSAGFPSKLVPGSGQIELAKAIGSVEFEGWIGKRYWFYRLVRLDVVPHTKP